MCLYTEKRKILYPEFVDIKNIDSQEEGNLRYSLLIPFFEQKEKGILVVILKNPSCAGRERCDFTIKRVCKVAYKDGYSGVIVLNLFPIRATHAEDVKEFYGMSDYDNIMLKNIEEIKKRSNNSHVVFAWGTDTIKGCGDFSKNYDNAIKNVIKAVASDKVYYMKNINESKRDKNVIYPLHGLRWSNDSKLIKLNEEEI